MARIDLPTLRQQNFRTYEIAGAVVENLVVDEFSDCG